eukprot:1013054_1
MVTSIVSQPLMQRGHCSDFVFPLFIIMAKDSPSTVFLDPEAAKSYQCSVCYDLFKDPVQIGCNDHIFCKKCISKLVSPGTDLVRCPICRVSSKASSIRGVKFIERQINALLVKCPNHQMTSEKSKYLNQCRSTKEKENIPLKADDDGNQDIDLCEKADGKLSGQKRKRVDAIDDDATSTHNHKKRKLNNQELCDWTGPLSDITSHQQHCPLELISCDHCEQDMLQRELEQHNQICTLFPIACADCEEDGILRSSMESHVQNECPMAMVSCPQKCGMQLQRKNEESHIADDCTQTMVDCQFHVYGCADRFKREDETKHNESTSHLHLCQVSDRVDELEAQNAKQQSQIDKLKRESQIQSDNYDLPRTQQRRPSIHPFMYMNMEYIFYLQATY